MTDTPKKPRRLSHFEQGLMNCILVNATDTEIKATLGINQRKLTSGIKRLFFIYQERDRAGLVAKYKKNRGIQ